MKTKVKSHGDEVTDIYVKKTPKVDYNHTCLEVTILDSALKNTKTIIPKSFSKSVIYWKKVVGHIDDNLSDFSSSDE